MAKWVFDQWDNTMEYPTLGFVAEPGDILDATNAPDARWSLNGDQEAAETVERFAAGGSSDFVETTDGYVLTYDAAQNGYVPTDPADNALLAATYARPLGVRVVGLGDSHVEGSATQGTPSDWRTNGNYPLGASMYAWGVWLTGGRVISVGNAGVGGERTDQILARLSEVTNTGADLCVVQMGTNDARQGTPLATTIANYAATIAGLRAAGIEPIAVGLPPINDPTAVRDAMDKINVWLRSYCQANAVRFVEILDPLVDRTNRTFLSTMHSDGVHLTALACQLAGQRIADVLLQVVSEHTNWLALTNVDSTNMLTNSLGLTDATADGIPDGWSTLGTPTGGTATHALEAVTGWVGNAYKITQSANTNTRQMYQAVNVSSGKFAVGDKVRFGLRGKTDGGVKLFAQVKMTGSSTARTITRALDLQSPTASDAAAVVEFTVQPGTTSLEVYLGVPGGTGVAWFGQPTLVNLTALGLD